MRRPVVLIEMVLGALMAAAAGVAAAAWMAESYSVAVFFGLWGALLAVAVALRA